MVFCFSIGKCVAEDQLLNMDAEHVMSLGCYGGIDQKDYSATDTQYGYEDGLSVELQPAMFHTAGKLNK